MCACTKEELPLGTDKVQPIINATIRGPTGSRQGEVRITGRPKRVPILSVPIKFNVTAALGKPIRHVDG